MRTDLIAEGRAGRYLCALIPGAAGGGPGSRGDVARVRCPAGTGLHPGALGTMPVGGEAPLDPGPPPTASARALLTAAADRAQESTRA